MVVTRRDSSRGTDLTPVRGEPVFDFTIYFLATLALLVVAYPLWFVIVASISDPTLVNLGRIWLIPKEASLRGYRLIVENDDIWIGYRNTIVYTIVGTAFCVTTTLLSGFALSFKRLPFRSVFMTFLVITMYFTGGIIPLYLVVQGLGMYNTMWAVIIPNSIGVWHIIITRTFFQSTIPESLYDSAQLDGASMFRYFGSIVMPISKAITAVLVIFYAVRYWNQYFLALIYLQDRNLFTLQLILREILVQNDLSNMADDVFEAMDDVTDLTTYRETIKYGVIIVSSLPVLVLYPFLQKYFIKGVLIGSLKG